ncbi:hypothetical protein [Streptacidiphilus carbonis]|jgi:hypothetical protein|uniref:hypothetical protein n=1 Tax=Streptacidiphilus carbonis TaxID=105422 RepID=UPI0005A9C909|nr:hypothetical protein [Streptacidiphilus carbonis]
MTSRPSLDQALGHFRGELEQHGRPLAELTLDQAWPAFQRFGQHRFATPSTPDADGLLFQYGTHTVHGPPMFVVDLTRQFEINDHNGEHDHFLQIHCELHYRPEPALERLGNFHRWYFHDTDDTLDQWAHELSPHLDLLPRYRPDQVHLIEEQV